MVLLEESKTLFPLFLFVLCAFILEQNPCSSARSGMLSISASGFCLDLLLSVVLNPDFRGHALGSASQLLWHLLLLLLLLLHSRQHLEERFLGEHHLVWCMMLRCVLLGCM